MSINRTILIGRLVKDPELRKTTNGTSVASFTLAVDNRTSREEKSTSFFQIVAWSDTADFVCKYLKKGYLVGVDGRLQQRGYENNNGVKVNVVEIIADNVQNYQPRESVEEQHVVASGRAQYNDEPKNDDDLPF